MEESTKRIVLLLVLVLIIVGGGLTYILVSSDVDVDLTTSDASEGDLISAVVNIGESARNLSTGEIVLSDIVFGLPSHNFQITLNVLSDVSMNALIRATATPAASNLEGAGLIYVPGSSIVNGVAVPDGIMGAGLQVSLSDEVNVITIVVEAGPAANFPVGASVFDIDVDVQADGYDLQATTQSTTRVVVKNEIN